jgi:hypothetical protein
MAELLTVAAIVAATAAADARLRVTAVADVLLRAVGHRTAEAERHTAAVDPPTVVAARHTGAAVAADMEGKNTLDCFPA